MLVIHFDSLFILKIFYNFRSLSCTTTCKIFENFENEYDWEIRSLLMLNPRPFV